MSEILRIPDGNAFKLRITGEILVENYRETADMSIISHLTVNFVRRGRLPQTASVDSQGRIVAFNNGSLARGEYGVELTGYYNGEPWRFFQQDVFEIVDASSEVSESTGSDVAIYDTTITVSFGGDNVSPSFVDATIKTHDNDDSSHPYLLQQLATLAQTVADIATAAAGGISTHNTSNTAHQDIRESLSGLSSAMQTAQEAILALQTAIQSAGKVDDVQIDGTSILDNKVANINSSQFGKVDDVLVNGTSVVINKQASITMPTKVSELDNDEQFTTQSEVNNKLAQKQDALDDVSAEVDNSTGTPSVTTSMNDGELHFAFHGLKGETGATGPTGPTGAQGPAAVFDPNTGNILATLEQTTGTKTANAMSQKAVTDAIQEPIQITYPIGTAKKYVKKDDGTLGSGDNYVVSKYIKLLGGEAKISCDNVYVGASNSSIASIAFFSAANTDSFISSVIGSSAAVPEGATHFRMTAQKTQTEFVVKHYAVAKQVLFDRLPTEGQIEKIENSVFSPITTQHKEVASHGYINSSGVFTSSGSWRSSGYIQLKGESEIGSDNAYTTTSSSSVVSRMAFYDADKVFISAISATNRDEKVSVPSTAKFVRMTAQPDINGYINQFNLTRYGTEKQDIYDKINNIENIVSMETTGLEGKTVAFIGDSITKGAYGVTAGRGYVNLFGQIAGCNVVNLGENSAVFVSNPSGSNESHPRLINKATSANLSNADMVVIFAGTNDFSYDAKPIGNHFAIESITPNTRIGSQKRIPPTDTDTFSGAVHEMILAVREIIGDKPMLIMTPINRGRTSATTYNPNSAECNINGDFLSDFVDALKDIGRFYSIPVFEVGAVFNADPTKKTGTGQSPYFYDCLHPNDAGHERLAKLLYKYIANHLVID